MNQFTALFSQCTTTAEIKTAYRNAALLHHPDRGGSTAAMQQLNNAYQAALKASHGRAEMGTDGRERTYTYNAANEEAIAAKIAELVGLNMEGVEIWLIGSWVWAMGDTKPHREALKAAQCFWNRKREAWAWHLPEHKSWHNPRADFSDLAATYGAKKFDAPRAQRQKLDA